MDRKFESMQMIATVGILLVGVMAIKLYETACQALSYWSSRGVSGPTPLLVIGNFHEFAWTPISFVFLKWRQKFGRMFGIYEGFKPRLVLQDAHLIREWFLKNGHIFLDRPIRLTQRDLTGDSFFLRRGIEGLLHRRVVTSAFTSSKMKRMFKLMEECDTKLDQHLSEIVERGVEVDANHLFRKFTTCIIARCAFGTEVDAYNGEKNILVDSLHSMVQINRWKLLLCIMIPYLGNFLCVAGKRSDITAIHRVCSQIIRERRKMRKLVSQSSDEYVDIMQLLLDANNSDSMSHEKTVDGESHHILEGETEHLMGKEKREAKKSLSEKEIIDTMILFFLAGYETSSTLLQYCAYVLTNNQQVQDTLYDELKKVYEEKGAFDYETIASNECLDAFVSETLRMYPPVMDIERAPNQPFSVNDDLRLSTDDSVYVPIYNLHHDAEYFPDPEKFDLTRFLPENRSNIVPCSYLPFGLGARHCMGMRFGLMEVKLFLANFIMKYKFVATKRTTRQLEFTPMALTFTTREIMVKIERRNVDVIDSAS